MTTILHTESSLGWGGQEIRILVEAIGTGIRQAMINDNRFTPSKIVSIPTGTNLENFDPENIEKLISKLALERKVVLLGHQEDIPKIVAALDVVIHPSYETHLTQFL